MSAAKTQVRMSTDERRQAILEAVRKVFARNGFHGTTTRELARAAGVSEALLFKHFPTKEALYSEMQQAIWEEISREDINRMMGLPPSTASLVVLVHFLVNKILHCSMMQAETGPTYMEQLMLRSMLEDGSFARGMLKRFEESWLKKFCECLAAARREGTIVESPVPDEFRGWLVHDMVVMTMVQMLPEPPVADHGLNRETAIRHSTWFALRGLGMKDDAISRFYSPEALAFLRQ